MLKAIVAFQLKTLVYTKWNILFDKTIVHYKLSVRYIETFFKGTL